MRSDYMMPGMNSKQAKQMERQMKKMGMNVEDLPGVKEVIIRFEDKELRIPNAEVNLMKVMGQETYQVSGTAVEVGIKEELVIPEEDIEMVASQGQVSKKEAEDALIATNGDLAEAILKLSQK
jgi:nascent polypeptide-associated complex subunit alpha